MIREGEKGAGPRERLWAAEEERIKGKTPSIYRFDRISELETKAARNWQPGNWEPFSKK
jgi:hypothetical protein